MHILRSCTHMYIFPLACTCPLMTFARLCLQHRAISFTLSFRHHPFAICDMKEGKLSLWLHKISPLLLCFIVASVHAHKEKDLINFFVYLYAHHAFICRSPYSAIFLLIYNFGKSFPFTWLRSRKFRQQRNQYSIHSFNLTISPGNTSCC